MAEVLAIGVLETRGFVPLIQGADAAVKAAAVDVIEWRKVGSGYVSFVIEGEVSAVRSAIEAAVAAASSVGEFPPPIPTCASRLGDGEGTSEQPLSLQRRPSHRPRCAAQAWGSRARERHQARRARRGRTRRAS